MAALGGLRGGSFILLWGNRIIYVPSFQRGNLLSCPGGVGVAGLVPLGLMGTKSGPVGGPCLPSPNHHGVSNRGPPRDHPDVPWCQEQGWDQQDTLRSQPVPCAWCGAGSGPKNEGVGVAAGRHCQIPPAWVQVLAQELPTEPCPCQCHHRGQHPGDSLSPAWPFQGKTRQNWGWAAAARHLTVCGTVSLQSFP